MPAKSEKQKNFMGLVYGVQQGKVPKSKVGDKVTKAADSMSKEDVKDFLMQECGLRECNIDVKRRILSALKEIVEPMNLEEEYEEDNIDPVATSKGYYGDFDKTVKMYNDENEFTPKENQAIQNFKIKPIEYDIFKVVYSKTDTSGNTSKIVIKKLKDSNGKFLYTAIVKIRAVEEKPDDNVDNSKIKGENIKLIKSIPIDYNEGSEILTNFLLDVYYKKA